MCVCVCDSRARMCKYTESIPAEKARFVNGNTKISLEHSMRLYGSAAAGEGYIYIMRRRRRKNVFLYIIIGPHLLNKTEICLSLLYILHI